MDVGDFAADEDRFVDQRGDKIEYLVLLDAVAGTDLFDRFEAEVAPED